VKSPRPSVWLETTTVCAFVPLLVIGWVAGSHTVELCAFGVAAVGMLASVIVRWRRQDRAAKDARGTQE
jgi:hypothetical protein